MTKKQFALIFAIWAIVMILIFATPVRGAEIGMVKSETTCLRSEIDLKATEIRLEQLIEMIEGSKDESALLVLKAEVQAVFKLNKTITMWRVENCKVS